MNTLISFVTMGIEPRHFVFVFPGVDSYDLIAKQRRCHFNPALTFFKDAAKINITDRVDMRVSAITKIATPPTIDIPAGQAISEILDAALVLT